MAAQIPPGFIGQAKKLDDIDIPRLGGLIGVGEDEIHAVMDVEASRSGFDKLGRPKILFERHVMYRLVKPELREEAERAKVATRAWKQIPYGLASEQYGTLETAMAIDRQAALKSASWGRGQVMGFNHRVCGFSTVDAMVAAMCDDEENHILAMVKFIKNQPGCAAALREHRWIDFARIYNGPNHAQNDYAPRLAAAFNLWARIKDTPFPSAQEDLTPAPAIEPVAPPAPTGPTPKVLIPAGPISVPAPPVKTGFWRRFFSAFLSGFQK